MSNPRTLDRPLLLLNLYLDNDTTSGTTQTKHFAGKGITFREIRFTAKVLRWGNVDRSISNPPGGIQIDDAEIELADDGNIRAWFDKTTPFRRIGEVIFDFERNVGQTSAGVELPVVGLTGEFTDTNLNPAVTEGPIQDERFKPLFTGEIIGARFEPGRAFVRLQEVTTKFLNWEIPKLITRDDFPNIPDDANPGAQDYTAPIIFGRVFSYTGTNIEPQGVIRCWLIDTTLNRYCVARHECYSVPTVYRKKKMDARFKVVDSSEYSINFPTFVIGGINYTFTVIDFIFQQEDGTVIHCDASGLDQRYNFATGEIITEIEQRNPVDSIFNLIFYAANDHPFTLSQPQTYIRFKTQSFIEARAAAAGMLCDGAITDSMTLGQAVGRICDEFGIDIFETNQAEIAVNIYNPASDSYIPISDTRVLLKTLEPELPRTVFTRVRYYYFRQNSHLTEWTKSSVEGQYEEEKTLDNITDQFELAQTGANPILEVKKKLEFVRDENTALALMKTRMGYYNLRSYDCEFELPMPEVILYLNLADAISLTHKQGLGPVGIGWAKQIMRVYALDFNLDSYRLRVRSIIRVSVPDDSFEYSGATPARDAQLRIPALPVLVNGTLNDGIGPEIDPDAEPQVNLNSVDPAAPTSPSWTDLATSGAGSKTLTSVAGNFTPDMVGGTINISGGTNFVVGTYFIDLFTSSNSIHLTVSPTPDGAGSLGIGATFVYANVIFQEDQTSSPRKVTAYYKIPKITVTTGDLTYVVGTLNPDTRPGGLTGADVYKVIFYSKDFDREYWWVGTGEDGTPSGWLAINFDAAQVCWFGLAPPTKGWRLCNGASGVYLSDYKGDVSVVTLPNLIGGVYPKGASSFTGAVINPVAPGITVGNHTHTTPSVNVPGLSIPSLSIPGLSIPDTSLAGDHNHTPVTATQTWLGTAGTHSHSVPLGSLTVTTSSDGAHSHSGYSDSDGTHTHSGATGPSANISTDHQHQIDSGLSYEYNHVHSVPSPTLMVDYSEAASALEGGEMVVSRVSTGGSETSGGGSGHTHYLNNPQTEVGGSTIFAGTIAVTVPSTGSDHSHHISSMSGGGHNHTLTVGGSITISGDGAHGHGGDGSIGVILTNNGNHTHSFSTTTGTGFTGTGTTGTATIGAGVTGGTTPTASADTTGEPKHMDLLPYVRL